MTQDKVNKLELINFIWDPMNEKWLKGYEELKEYFKKHQTSLIPLRYKAPSGYALGEWVAKQRVSKKNKNLSQERISKLNNLQMVWDPKDAEWDEKYKALIKYYEKYQTTLVPKRTKTADGINLGSWVQNQRQSKRNNKLSSNKIKKLNELGFKWKHDEF